MSYTSIKRILGETNLERKCRILFGVCMLLLIGGAFYGVDRVTEKLVKDTTRNKARDLAAAGLLHKHFRSMDPDEEKNFTKFADRIAKTMQVQDTQLDVLTLHKDFEMFSVSPIRLDLEKNEEEAEILRRLEKQIEDRAKARKNPEPSDEEVSDETLPALFAERSSPEKDYQYYTPIHWDNSSCRVCHMRSGDDAASPASEGGPRGVAPPLHALRVTIPYKETQKAINRTRAIMIAVAVLTVFFAVIALYVIVRYVIVKPLQHLRNVSDDISRGKTELRAEVSTGDEFEELAASFNRMLHHMTEAQNELRDVNVDLDAKVDQLAQLNMRLHEMNQVKSEFLANMSHELRTPLNSIIGFSEVLQGITSLNDKQKRYAENIRKSGRLLLEMINDILDLAKLEAGKMEVRPSEIQIEALIHAHCDMVRSMTDEKNIDLNVEVVSGLPPVFQDQAKVQQILTNLLSNAIKFTPEGGRITVSAAQVGGNALDLTVADTGVGITEDEQDLIFEKFRQGTGFSTGDNLTREHTGTGLGLSIVRELCRLLCGEVSLTSEVGKGSTFCIRLPWSVADQSGSAAKLNSQLDQIARPQRSSLDEEAHADHADGKVAASTSITN
jgi:two-component system sensor histidine kinase BarA